MNDAPTLFKILRQSADPVAAAAIERHAQQATDQELARVNVVDFAARCGLQEEHVIGAFLHAARLGLFDLLWNVLCPQCGGVLDSNATLKSVRCDEYPCALCATDYEITLDDMVEVTFTVTPRVRRIAAHDPETLPFAEYMRQIFWSTGMALPNDSAFERLLGEAVLEMAELPPGEKAILSLQLSAQSYVVFDPVTHATQFIDVRGEETRERQGITHILSRLSGRTEKVTIRPGPLRLALVNSTDTRVLPSLWIAGEAMSTLLRKRKPFLTAKRLLTNQTFREIYRTDALEVDQRLKITSLTFVFTDLKGSTNLYERVGDLVAYDIVRAHFRVLHEVVVLEGGSIVKTIGDAVMATFATPDRAVAAALKMREAMQALNAERKPEDLLLKIGLHEGPCLAVMLNDRLDYFGQTVNIAARVQGLAVSRSIFATNQVVADKQTARLLDDAGLTPMVQMASLRGITDALTVYEIP